MQRRSSQPNVTATTERPSGRVDGPCAHVHGGVAMPKFVQYRGRNQDLAEERGPQIDVPDQYEIVQRRRGMGGSFRNAKP